MEWTFYGHSLVKKNVLSPSVNSAISLHNGIKDDIILLAIKYFYSCYLACKKSLHCINRTFYGHSIFKKNVVEIVSVEKRINKQKMRNTGSLFL